MNRKKVIDEVYIEMACDWCSVNEPDADEARVKEVAYEILEAELNVEWMQKEAEKRQRRLWF